MTPLPSTITPPTPHQSPEASQDSQAEVPAPARDDGSGFAEQKGPIVVLLMGIVLFILACESFFTGKVTVAFATALAAVVTVVIASGLARLRAFKVEILKLIGFSAKFGDDS